MSKLKRCPFCGYTAEIINVAPFLNKYSGRKGVERWQVGCTGCGVVTAAFPIVEDAVDKWNMRIGE